MCQDALARVRPGSPLVSIAIRMYAESGRVILEIRERGEDGPPYSGSLALLQLEERARSFGGTVSFKPLPGEGRVLYIGLPVSSAAAASSPRGSV